VRSEDFFFLHYSSNVSVPGVMDVYSVACGQQHTVVMTSSGRIFVWGSNKHGQLGVDPILQSTITTPKEIFFPQRPNGGCILLSGWTHVVILTGISTQLIRVLKCKLFSFCNIIFLIKFF
jgi:alpha-tubulin suppressor-like RCC1 family protein